jgi:PAS domain S-box-containing protein
LSKAHSPPGLDGLFSRDPELANLLPPLDSPQTDLAGAMRILQALYKLVDRIHRAESLPEIHDAALNAILDALQCDRASILLFDDAKVMRFAGWRGLSAEYRRAVEGHSPWTAEEQDPEPLAIDDIAHAQMEASLRTVIANEGIAALSFIPLVSGGRLIGKFMAYFDTPHAHTEHDLELALTIARQLSFGIERQRAEEARRESEERFRELANNIDQFAWTLNENAQATWYNDRWYEYTGTTLEEMKAGAAKRIRHPLHVDRVTERFQQCVAKGEAWEDTFPLRGKDGQYRWFLSRAVPIRDQNGRIIRWFGTNTDVTELRELEEALREADHRKDEFLATLAHELRNPLAPIRNAVQILRLKGPPSLELQWAREVIDRQVQQMTRLIDDLMDVSRITRNKIELRKELVELGAILQSAVEICRPVIDASGHTIAVSLPQQPVYLNADATRMAQVFSNLLNNASKYSEKAGPIEILVDREGDKVAVRVRDHGIGIPREMLASIFDLFTQVDRSLERAHGGLGIGLTLVKRLVEMHGGSVTAESGGAGQGSMFIVRLPVATALPAPRDGLVTNDRPLDAPQAHRILIVDDNEDAATSLSVMLTILGYDTRTAADGLAGLDAAAQFRPEAILLDIGIPKLNGYDVARRLREESWGKKIVLIAVTGWGQAEDIQRTIEAGFDHHLVKPVDPTELTKLLSSLTAESDSRPAQH